MGNKLGSSDVSEADIIQVVGMRSPPAVALFCHFYSPSLEVGTRWDACHVSRVVLVLPRVRMHITPLCLGQNNAFILLELSLLLYHLPYSD